jgi:hypothetical protein
MAIREVDAISNAIIETEREIAGSAWDQEDTELDETGDRSNEEMGEGLEGQHEADDEVELEADEADGETETEAETAEAEAAAAAAAAANGKDKTAEKPAAEVSPEGRVPSAKYREVAERARAAETERDALKAQIEKSGGENKSLTERLDLVMREIADIKRIPRSEAKPAEPPKPKAAVPDMFENPTGFVEHITGMFQSELEQARRSTCQSARGNLDGDRARVAQGHVRKSLCGDQQAQPAKPR